MNTADSICAAICTYNRYDKLDFAINSLINQKTEGISHEIIVVDNTPDKFKKEEIKEKYQSKKKFLYLNESTPGLSNARNIAARNTSANVISYLDDDAIASPNWLQNIIKAFKVSDNVGVVGGRIDPIWEIEKPTWINESLFGYLSIINWGGDLRISTDKEWFAGANIAFQTKLVREVGFNTNLGRNGNGSNLLSNEETLLIENIRKRGYKSVYSPDAIVKHLIVRDRLNQKWFRKRVAWQAISDFIARGDTAENNPEKFWNWFLDYMWECAPEERSLKGLMTYRENHEDFKKQLDSIYNFTTSLIAGFKD